MNTTLRYVIGIDPSLTSTGVIVLDDTGEVVCCELTTSTPCGPLVASRMLRYTRLVDSVVDVVTRYPPTVVCIEGYSLGSNKPGKESCVEYGGALRMKLIESGCRLLEVPPTTLKKWATGKGAFPGGGKTPLIVAMTARYGVQFGTDDEYDAYALARIAHQIAGWSEPETEFQRETIAVVTSPKEKKAKKRKAVAE